MPDCAEENCAKRSQLIERIRRHHAAMMKVVVRAPVEIGVVETNTVLFRRGSQHLPRRRHHFLPNSITRYHRDSEAVHVTIRKGIPIITKPSESSRRIQFV